MVDLYIIQTCHATDNIEVFTENQLEVLDAIILRQIFLSMVGSSVKEAAYFSDGYTKEEVFVINQLIYNLIQLGDKANQKIQEDKILEASNNRLVNAYELFTLETLV
ncbi:MAG: hypothetical protein ABIC04_02470 [Nanoarchaeota archaeon]